MKRIVLAAMVCILTACGGSDPQPDPTPVEQQTKAVEPTADDMKKCPCGKGDWEQLPPGTKAEETEAEPKPTTP